MGTRLELGQEGGSPSKPCGRAPVCSGHRVLACTQEAEARLVLARVMGAMDEGDWCRRRSPEP